MSSFYDIKFDFQKFTCTKSLNFRYEETIMATVDNAPFDTIREKKERKKETRVLANRHMG